MSFQLTHNATVVKYEHLCLLTASGDVSNQFAMLSV